MTSVLALVRDETAALHQQLEARVRIESRLQDVTLYRGLLETFLGIYEPLERRLEADGLNDWHIDLRQRRKTPLLRSDLRALGHSAASLEDLPVCTALPEVSTTAQRFGCAYVLEGSTLGGRQILALLEGSPVARDARSFFSGYGASTGVRWKEFCWALESYGKCEPACHQAVADAAVRTFSAFDRWLSGAPARNCLQTGAVRS